MSDQDANYYINNPVFINYKDRFDLRRFGRRRYLKSVFINERIVEIPFAIECLHSLGKRGKILDLGCTESVLPLFLAGLGYQVTGYDFRKYPYIFPNLDFQKGDICNTPFEDETFDAVLCISTLEHVGLGFYADPRLIEEADGKAITEVFRILKKGGLFVLTVPFGAQDLNKHQRVYDGQALEKLLKPYIVEEKKFFRTLPGNHARNNYWKQVNQEEASEVKSSEESTACVCLIKARK